MSSATYQRLVALVGGDEELIVRLVEEGVIQRLDVDRVLVDVDQVLVVRTLVRKLEIDWPGVELILRLRDELAESRRRIVELEAALALRSAPTEP